MGGGGSKKFHGGGENATGSGSVRRNVRNVPDGLSEPMISNDRHYMA